MIRDGVVETVQMDTNRARAAAIPGGMVELVRGYRQLQADNHGQSEPDGARASLQMCQVVDFADQLAALKTRYARL